jgi:hypothetical protein
MDPHGLMASDEWRMPRWLEDVNAQPAADFAAGFGDTLTTIPFTDICGTCWIRELTGSDQFVNRCSDAYFAGEISGIIAGAALGGAGGGKYGPKLGEKLVRGWGKVAQRVQKFRFDRASARVQRAREAANKAKYYDKVRVRRQKRQREGRLTTLFEEMGLQGGSRVCPSTDMVCRLRAFEGPNSSQNDAKR